MIETDEAVRVSAKPTYAELERAIASVPGVEEAHVTLLPDTGRSRLRIRLANGEDAPTVSWAISATLRERFGIVLDPGAIRPKLSVSETPTTPRDEDAGDSAGSGEPEKTTQPSVSTPRPASRPEAVDARPEAAPTTASTSDPGRTGVSDAAHQGSDGDAVEAASAGGDTPEDQTGADTIDDPIEGKVVVIGDRVQLNEAARAVLAESLEMGSPQEPLDVTTGPTARGPRVLEPVGDDPDAATSEAEAEAGARQGDGPVGAGADPLTTVMASAQDTPEDSAHDAAQGPVSPAESPTSHRRKWSGGQKTEEAAAIRRGHEASRAAIRHLDTQIDVSDVRVTATLAHGSRSVTGEASSVPTRKGILRAVAEATVSALRQLTGDRLVVGVDSVVASVAGEPPMATVLVGIVTEAGEETLLGSSLVRQDPERAVMRATLDALNRRIEPWLEVDLAG